MIRNFRELKIFGSIVIVILIVINMRVPNSFTGNSANGKLDYNKIYKYKTAYVGDASKIGGLVRNLDYSKYSTGIALETAKQPYGIIANYLVNDESMGKEITPTNKMFQNAAIIFCLVDNVEKVTFNFVKDGKTYTIPFNRQSFNAIYNRDIREYSKSVSVFKSEFVPMIEKQNWAYKGVTNNANETFKGLELYVWKNKSITGTDNIFYTLLPGTNRTKTDKEIYNLKIAMKDINEVNKALSKYNGDTHLSVLHGSSFTKEYMINLDKSIIFKGSSRSIGVFGDMLNESNSNDVAGKIEKK